MSDYDYSAYEETPEHDALHEVQRLVKLLEERERDVVSKELELKAAQAALRQVKEFDLPDALQELGLAEVTTASGLRVSVQESVHVSLPVKDRTNYIKGLAWLEKRGYGKLIEPSLQAKFSPGEGEKAEEWAARLREEGLSVTADERVHPSRIKSLISKCLEDGEDVPLDVFKVHKVRTAVLK